MKVVSWNCQGAFRRKLPRALTLGGDVLVIQEAEPPATYSDVLPEGWQAFYEIRPGNLKGLLVLSRPGLVVAPHPLYDPAAAFAHVVPMRVTDESGGLVELMAVWTLAAKPRERAYVGQAHLALDAYLDTLGPRSVVIGDFNSNAIWDHEHRRSHTALVDRLGLAGLESAYHRLTGEAQGSESQPTFFLYRHEDKPFHLDFAFVGSGLQIQSLELGSYSAWSGPSASGGVSDHLPLSLTVG